MRSPLRLATRRLPWPVRCAVGLLAAALGLWLVGRPVTSATTLTVYLGLTALVVGLSDLTAAAGSRLRAVVGSGWLLLGAVAVLVPGRAAAALPVAVAVALVAGGVVRLSRARGGAVDVRLAALFLGVAEVVLGVVALAWPDVTLVVAAVVFGIRAVLTGTSLAWEALWRRDRPVEDAPGAEGLLARTRRVLVAVVALAVSLGVLALSSTARDRAPQVDDFYAAPSEAPDEPGRLLRAEPFHAQVPAGARAWRILHTTTDHDGTPAVASGIVVVPTAPGPHPVVAWAHGTTGQARRCAPSLLDEPFTAGAFPEVLDDVVQRGWAVVATDYLGLGAGEEHAYLVGRVAGRAVLDSVRAARELDDVRLGDGTVVWGHSQGGAAALWTAQVQQSYAPDVPLAGTAAMAPASRPRALADDLADVTGGSVLAAFVVQGYASAYDDVRLRDVVRPAAVPLVRRMASRCLSEPGVLASVLTALSMRDEDVLRRNAAAGPLGRRLEENEPDAPGRSPLWIAQGAADTLITPRLQRDYVAGVRAGGREVDLAVYPGLDHLSLVQEGSPMLADLLAWTEARLAD